MHSLLRSLWSDESGQDTTEYVLLVVLIALAATIGMGILAQAINAGFSASANALVTPS